jgi:hypothetical protein
MLTRVIAGTAGVLSPLIEEARDRQRRRRLALLQAAALAAVLGLAAATAGRGGSAQNGLDVSALSDPASVQAQVRDVIADFDGAVGAGDFVRACSLLDPWMGVTIVRASTDGAGIRGSCEQRLAAFVRIAGPKLVAALERSSIDSVEVAGSLSRGFTAAASMQVADEIVRRNQWAQTVGVAKRGPGARVLIICPPLLCASQFLTGYSALTRGRSGRS